VIVTVPVPVPVTISSGPGAYAARPEAAASGIPLIDDANGKLTLRTNSRLG
jgi:hypothetical protein